MYERSIDIPMAPPSTRAIDPSRVPADDSSRGEGAGTPSWAPRARARGPSATALEGAARCQRPALRASAALMSARCITALPACGPSCFSSTSSSGFTSR